MWARFMKWIKLHIGLSFTGFCYSVGIHWLEELTVRLEDMEVLAASENTALSQAHVQAFQC